MTRTWEKLCHKKFDNVSFVICVPIRVSVDVLYCITTEEDHRSVVETFAWKNKFLLNLQASVKA